MDGKEPDQLNNTTQESENNLSLSQSQPNAGRMGSFHPSLIELFVYFKHTLDFFFLSIHANSLIHLGSYELNNLTLNVNVVDE